MSNRTKIAIIPARGGSKRIPRKNIKDFLGKSIISYSIEAALKSDLFNEVMVSTDDAEIAEVSKKFGANIPFMRSAENANDFATTADVLLEVLTEYGKRKKIFDYLCCIYPTAVFVTEEKLKDTFSLMIEKNADSLILVVKSGYAIQRAFRINEHNMLEYIWPQNINKRSQDLEPAYHDAGQFYWAKTDKFLEEKKLVLKNTLPFILTEVEAHDIDTEEDWEIAEKKFNRYSQ